MSNRILIICAHPDDEVLGCGASIARWQKGGAELERIIMTAGVSGRHSNVEVNQELTETQQSLRAQAERAGRVLGISNTTYLNFPDNRMDTVTRMDLAHAIKPVVEEFRPRMVLTHHAGDYNWDHRLTFDATLMAARSSPGEWLVDEIWSYEVLSSTERAAPLAATAFLPNVYVDIEATLETKKEALKIYEQECRDWPHPRSMEGVDALARKRGSEVGLAAAEAFQSIRRIER